jgi:hypothetical protein
MIQAITRGKNIKAIAITELSIYPKNYSRKSPLEIRN